MEYKWKKCKKCKPLISMIHKLSVTESVCQVDTQMAGPNGSFLSAGACNLEVPGSNLGRVDICHRGTPMVLCSI